MKDDLIENIDKLHTTALGVERIKKNLALNDIDVVAWCKDAILCPETDVKRQGKNWYAVYKDNIITVNAYSYTIITAHKEKKK